MHKGFAKNKEWNLTTFLNKQIKSFCNFCENYDEENKKALKTCQKEYELTTIES